jgi:malate dehydrogenase
MAIVSDGSYGIAEGLIAGVPCTASGGAYQVVRGLDTDEFSRGRIDASVAELVDERDAVKELGLI